MLHSELIPARDADSRRLLVMLHGLADSMEGYRWLPELLRLDWLNYLLVNAPDEYYGGYSWYDFAGDPSPGILRSSISLNELLDTMVQKGYPSDCIILGGFSQGCLMAIETGLRYPHRLAGIIGISGYISDLPKLKREFSPIAKQQRVFMSHGTQDPIIPFANVRKQAAELKAAGINVEWHEFAKPHSIAGESEISIVRSFIKSCFK